MDEALNLKMQRGERSVWDAPPRNWNVAAEDRLRLMAMACGSVLAALGARRRGFSGGVLAAMGGTLTMRALMGCHDMNAARAWIDRVLLDRGWRRPELVDDTSADSFPASDAPAWTGSNATTEGR